MAQELPRVLIKAEKKNKTKQNKKKKNKTCFSSQGNPSSLYFVTSLLKSVVSTAFLFTVTLSRGELVLAHHSLLPGKGKQGQHHPTFGFISLTCSFPVVHKCCCCESQCPIPRASTYLGIFYIESLARSPLI